MPTANISLKLNLSRASKMAQINKPSVYIPKDMRLLFHDVIFIDIWSHMMLPNAQQNSLTTLLERSAYLSFRSVLSLNGSNSNINTLF